MSDHTEEDHQTIRADCSWVTNVVVTVGPAPGHSSTPLTMNDCKKKRLILYLQRGEVYLQQGWIHYIIDHIIVVVSSLI